MARSLINGAEQLKANSVTSGQVDTSVIVAGGGNAFTGAQSMGSNKLTSLANGTNPNDAINLSQLQAYINGLSPKGVCVAATTGAETYTVASGSVTQITGTTVDGITIATGDRLLVMNAPAASGAGVAASAGIGSLEPGNGIYTATVTGNIALVRDTTSDYPLSGTVDPSGAYVIIAEGTANGAVGFVVTSPGSPDTAFTYGTTNMQWTMYAKGTGVTTVSVVSANGLAGSVANPNTTPAITLSTTITGVLKGNGTAISAASSGTDYIAPSEIVFNEVCGGTLNSSNQTFTLANTPLAAGIMLFLNGQLLRPGSSNDYTLSATTITLQSSLAPASTDILTASYLH